MISPELKAAILNRRMLICIFTGFVSGLPLYILFQLVPAWLRKEGIGLAEIGFFALIQLPYAWKFVWAPLMDRYTPFKLGRRRSWMLLTQVLLLLFIGCLGFFSPTSQLWVIASLSTAVALFSATQDITLDAYRRELLPDEELGLGNSIHIQAYRISGLIPAGLSLVLADIMPWESVFMITAGFMVIGVILTLVIREEVDNPEIPASFRDSIELPFKDFFSRMGKSGGLWALVFLFFYKLGDNMAVALATPFYIDLGFSLTEIGLVAKNAGLWPSVIGGLFGGALMIKIGINRALWLFGVVQLVTILGFAVLAEVGNNLWVLAIVVGMEYLGVGLGSAAIYAYMARATNPVFAATQLALLSALATMPRVFASASSGLLVEAMGWTTFYIFCAALAVPGMLLLFKVAPWNEQAQ